MSILFRLKSSVLTAKHNFSVGILFIAAFWEYKLCTLCCIQSL